MSNTNSLDEHQIFLQGPVVVFKWQNAPSWPVEYVSANIEKELGYSKQDFMSGAVRYADIVYPDDLDRVFKEVMELSDRGLKEFEQEYRIIKANGDVIWNKRRIYERPWATLLHDKRKRDRPRFNG